MKIETLRASSLLLTVSLMAGLTASVWAASKNKLDARARDLTDYFESVQRYAKSDAK